MEHSVLEEYLRWVVDCAVPLVEACGLVVILVGVAGAVLQQVRSRFHLDTARLTSLRSGLIQSLVLGLEFQLAADVLKTATAHTLSQVAVLAALIGLRIVLGLVLERELHSVCWPSGPHD